MGGKGKDRREEKGGEGRGGREGGSEGRGVQYSFNLSGSFCMTSFATGRKKRTWRL